MLARLIAGLFAVVLVLGAGLRPALAHFCAMSGEVNRCCCHESSDQRDEGRGTQIERDKRCCEVRVSDPGQPTVTLPRDTPGAQEVQLATVAVPPAVPIPRRPARDRQVLPPGARGPPARTGPPLFLRKRSLLL